MQTTTPYPPFSVTVRHLGATDLVIVTGELDRSTGPRLTAVVENALGARDRVVLDLSAMSFIDVGGVRVLLALVRAAEQRRCRLDIRAGRVGAEMFELIGIDPRRPRPTQRVTRLRTSPGNCD